MSRFTSPPSPWSGQSVQSEQGSIYLEALAAMAILTLALLPIFGGFSLTSAAQERAARETAALNVARARLEQVQALDGAGWTALVSSGGFAADPLQPEYQVATAVGDRQGVANLKDVTVTVRWIDHRSREHRVTLTTSVARRP